MIKNRLEEGSLIWLDLLDSKPRRYLIIDIVRISNSKEVLFLVAPFSSSRVPYKIRSHGLYSIPYEGNRAKEIGLPKDSILEIYNASSIPACKLFNKKPANVGFKKVPKCDLYVYKRRYRNLINKLY